MSFLVSNVSFAFVFFPNSGLLTEVQCQSKRLRKGSKGRGAEEEESADSRKVSSSSKLPGQVGPQWEGGITDASTTRNTLFTVDGRGHQDRLGSKINV